MKTKTTKQMTLAELEEKFASEDDCKAYLAARRWAKGVGAARVCPCREQESPNVAGALTTSPESRASPARDRAPSLCVVGPWGVRR